MTEARSKGKSNSHPADIRRSLSKSAAKPQGKSQRSANNVEWASVLDKDDVDALNGLGDLEDDDIPPNDDPFMDDSDDDSNDPNWPAYEGDIGDYWDDSSGGGDFV